MAKRIFPEINFFFLEFQGRRYIFKQKPIFLYPPINAFFLFLLKWSPLLGKLHIWSF